MYVNHIAVETLLIIGFRRCHNPLKLIECALTFCSPWDCKST